jgi:hypothetical protein
MGTLALTVARTWSKTNVQTTPHFERTTFQNKNIMSHEEGVCVAIDELNDRKGSSMIAVKELMQANLPKDKKWLNGAFLDALKAGVAAGDLVQVKGSCKFSADFKKAWKKKNEVSPNE